MTHRCPTETRPAKSWRPSLSRRRRGSDLAAGSVGGMRATTTGGTVEGFETDGILQFRNIPYAASPAGEGRFRAPQPVEPWSGVRDATQHGAIAPQAASMLDSMLGTKQRPMDEDCLTLTVTTPSLDGSRPVMVWIHGGGFQTGSGSVPWYDGRQLAGHGDVVVVAINYRLGALGWLRVDQLLGDDYAGSGNNGLRDQIAALQWVQENIAGFGGDPGQVTIFGESAGGMSVATLLGTPAAAGLFRRAVAQSGACHNVAEPDEAAAVTAAVLRQLGGDDDADPELLLTTPAEHLVAAQEAAAADLLRPAGTRLRLPYAPQHDGAVLPEQPLERIAAGHSSDVSLLTGTTADEWALFQLGARQRMDDERLGRRFERQFPGRGIDALDVYRRSRPDATADELWVALMTDVVFRIPAVRLAEAQAAHQPDTWMYRFSHRSPAFDGRLGACHAIEIPFVFDNLARGGVGAFVGDTGDELERLAAVTSSAWLSFARNGDPSHEGLPAWPRFDAEHRAVMDLDSTCQLLHDPNGSERQLFDGVL